MKTEDLVYFESRAQAEMRKALLLDEPTAKRIHFELAARYFEKVRKMANAIYAKAA